MPAPPGPADLGPATGLSTPPPDAIVFDLKYRPQTGSADDIQYHSYWGYGGSDSAQKNNPFLQDVRKKASRLYYVNNPTFKGREWAAVEYGGGKALAFYFDLNADGKLAENERIPPTRKMNQGFEFITPDFMQRLEDGGQTLCRTLLAVNFYGGSSEPNCMWSPAALLEGTATLNGRPARLLLFASGPGRAFDKHGSSSYALQVGPGPKNAEYIPRETLSSLISSEGQFFHLKIEGRRTNGLPARAVLVKDTSPVGSLALKLVGSNSLQATLSSLSLHGVDDPTVFFHVSSLKEKVSVPVGTYALDSGMAAYGVSNRNEWEVSFTKGPSATVAAGEVREVALGQPTLKIRAVKESDRYNPKAEESATFKQGARIYLEPRLVGKAQEVFSRFRQATTPKRGKTDCPPRITITGPDGKEVLSKVMEYG